MKAPLAFFFALVVCINSAWSQGVVTVDPIPVMDGTTGLPADNTFAAGLYFAAGNVSEESLTLVSSYIPFSGGFAFSSSPIIIIPAYTSGPATFQVRASSSGYTYETALASGLSSVLAGKSTLLTIPSIGPGQSLTFSGFTLQPAPEPSVTLLGGVSLVLWGLLRKKAQWSRSTHGQLP